MFSELLDKNVTVMTSAYNYWTSVSGVLTEIADEYIKLDKNGKIILVFKKFICFIKEK